MYKNLKTYTFTKNKKGNYINKEKLKRETINKDTNNKETQKKDIVNINKKSTSPIIKNYDTEEYIGIEEIYKQLRQQKAEAKINNPLNNFNYIEKIKIPVDINSFCIHQYNYNDTRNKIHKQLRNDLINMIHNGYVANHLILYGLSGSGKYTLALSLLHSICGDAINKRIIRTQNIEKKTVKYIENEYYLEVLVNNYVLNDDKTLSMFIKNNVRNKNSGQCQYVILKHFDELTDRCQKSIFHIMEKNSNIRFIITTRHINKINNNIKSNACLIRVPRPEPKQLAKYLNKMAKNNEYKISHSQIEHVVRSAECNISQALTTLELCCLNPDSTYIKQKDPHLKYIADILQIATGPCVENIREVRRLVSKLVITTYDVSDVYRTCTKLFLNSNYDINIKKDIIEIANKYSRLNNITHDTIFIMEAFFLHVMRIINNQSTKKNYSLQKMPKK